MELHTVPMCRFRRLCKLDSGFQGCRLSTSIVLVCAVLASLAAGVLIAYGICVAMFALFDSHVRQIAPRPASQVAVTNPVTEN